MKGWTEPEFPDGGWQVILGLILGLIACALLCMGCAPQKEIVREVHTQTVSRIDTIHHTDSFFHEKNTIVRELDSAAMAEFGIHINGMQKAWLVESKTLQKEIERLKRIKADSVIIIDTIPQPYPVIKEVEKPLTKWQKARIWIGNIMLVLLVAFGIFKIRKFFI